MSVDSTKLPIEEIRMAPNTWEEYALQLAREGDVEAPARQQLYREQINQCLDGMSQYTQETAREEMSLGHSSRQFPDENYKGSESKVPSDEAARKFSETVVRAWHDLAVNEGWEGDYTFSILLSRQGEKVYGTSPCVASGHTLHPYKAAEQSEDRVPFDHAAPLVAQAIAKAYPYPEHPNKPMYPSDFIRAAHAAMAVIRDSTVQAKCPIEITDEMVNRASVAWSFKGSMRDALEAALK
jgi:uncharacterized protein (DUF924 family)